MFEKLRDLWTRIVFFFKPTYYVFSDPQRAVDLLPPRGGTLVFNGSEFRLPKGGLVLPHKDVRLVGGIFYIADDGIGIKVKGISGKRVIVLGCCFMPGVNPKDWSPRGDGSVIKSGSARAMISVDDVPENV